MNTHDTPLAQVDFVAFDLETTGLFAIGCRIVEIGAVRFRLDGTEIATFEQLIDPQCEISEEVRSAEALLPATLKRLPHFRALAIQNEHIMVPGAHSATTR